MSKAIVIYWNTPEGYNQVLTTDGKVLWDSRYDSGNASQAYHRLLTQGYEPSTRKPSASPEELERYFTWTNPQ